MLLEKYLSKTVFDSYEDFERNFKINIPDDFNFAYDVADEIADKNPGKTVLVWCDENGNEAIFTFGQLKYHSDRAANFFRSAGIGKGDPVMLILKRRYEFWFAILALHKIGAVAVPATHLLTTKDIIYRNNSADIKMILCVNEPDVMQHVDESQEQSPSLSVKAALGVEREGWFNLNSEI